MTLLSAISGIAGLRWAALLLPAVSGWLIHEAVISWGWNIQNGFTATSGTCHGWRAARLLPVHVPH